MKFSYSQAKETSADDLLEKINFEDRNSVLEGWSELNKLGYMGILPRVNMREYNQLLDALLKFYVNEPNTVFSPYS